MSLKKFLLIVIGLAVCFSCCHLIGRFSFPLGLIAGASAATMLIFILPAAFYLRLVKSLPLRSPQKIGVSVQKHTCSHTQCFLLYPLRARWMWSARNFHRPLLYISSSWIPSCSVSLSLSLFRQPSSWSWESSSWLAAWRLSFLTGSTTPQALGDTIKTLFYLLQFPI